MEDDPLNLAYLSFLALGMGTLLPWNAFISASDYFEHVFTGRHCDRLITVAYLPVNLAVLCACIHFHARLRPAIRVLVGFAGFCVSVGLMPLLVLLPPARATLGLTLLLVACVGACDGLAQGALFGEASLLPQRYTQALVSGTALSGVAVSALRIATKATLPDTPAGLRSSALAYFTIAAGACVACLALYAFALPALPAVQRGRRAALERALAGSTVLTSGDGDGDGGDSGQERARRPQGSERARLVDGGSPIGRSPGASPRRRGGRSPEASPQRKGGSLDLELSREDHHYAGQGGGSLGSSLLGGSTPQKPGATPGDERAERAQQAQRGLLEQSSPAWATTLKEIWRLAAANFTIYAVTLSIFPGVLAEDVRSTRWGSWYPVCLIGAFNLCDWAGKSLPSVARWRAAAAPAILHAALARLLFIPGFHLAATTGAGGVLVPLLTCALGLSNGYLTACAMMAAPACVPERHAPLAGNLMVLSLSAGLCVGAAAGFLWLL